MLVSSYMGTKSDMKSGWIQLRVVLFDIVTTLKIGYSCFSGAFRDEIDRNETLENRSEKDTVGNLTMSTMRTITFDIYTFQNSFSTFPLINYVLHVMNISAFRIRIGEYRSESFQVRIYQEMIYQISKFRPRYFSDPFPFDPIN